MWAESDAALLQNDWLHGMGPCVVWLQHAVHVGGILPAAAVVVVVEGVVVAVA